MRKVVTTPVKNSLTKLIRLPPDLTLLEKVPFLSGRGREGWRIEPLGSVTNQTYRLDVGQHSYVVRVAGSTTRYLDRAVETHNAAIAAELGLAPPVLYLDDKLLVTRFVSGARPLSIGDLADPIRLQQVGDLLSRLQRSPRAFRHERHPFGEIDRYLGACPHPRAMAFRRALQPVEVALAGAPRPLVPAHVDASVANFLLGADGRLWLVDWEFSSMADPAWDPASVLMHRTMDDDAARGFIATVLGDAEEPAVARIGLFKAALCLVAGSWCAMEAAARRDDALIRLAETYLDRGEALLADPGLPRWLQAV
jgi:thiamine kinase-like enzyme